MPQLSFSNPYPCNYCNSKLLQYLWGMYIRTYVVQYVFLCSTVWGRQVIRVSFKLSRVVVVFPVLVLVLVGFSGIVSSSSLLLESVSLIICDNFCVGNEMTRRMYCTLIKSSLMYIHILWDDPMTDDSDAWFVQYIWIRDQQDVRIFDLRARSTLPPFVTSR